MNAKTYTLIVGMLLIVLGGIVGIFGAQGTAQTIDPAAWSTTEAADQPRGLPAPLVILAGVLVIGAATLPRSCR